MIEADRFTLGEQCAPYQLTRYVPENGKLIPHQVTIYGRKVPLLEIRKRLLVKQEKYMRLLTDAVLFSMSGIQLLDELCRFGWSSEELITHNDMCATLAKYQRHRSLTLWHDHATILGSGFILLTVHTTYDAAVFLTDREYMQMHQGSRIRIQSEIEQPEIYLLSLGSSSVADQAALIGDRCDCLLQSMTPVTATNSVEVYDTVQFFTGDHPALQFECGTQQGGKYKCGTCGCADDMFEDQSHSLRFHWRQLKELQHLAINGVYGKTPGKTKPFDKLRVEELRKELRARKMYDLDQPKLQLKKSLDEILRGVQRVPAMLLLNPTQGLNLLHLERYEVMACEPLHDLKGHLKNLLEELQHILPLGEVSTKIRALLESSLCKDKLTGADIRRTVIQALLLLNDYSTCISEDVALLLKTAVKIGAILYSCADNRTPRALLQLYNHCWLHHELCVKFFHFPQKMTRTKMFSHYLHALTAHAPTQYEIVCLRSINTENQERLFGQARQIARKRTNHQPQNIIPQVLIRLQAKQEQRHVLQSIHTAESQVSSIAASLDQEPRTTIHYSFIKARQSSWQAHLERISHFLVLGKGVWWEHTDEGYCFFDGDSDLSHHPEGPALLHFRDSSIEDVEKRRKLCWNMIVEQQIPLPAKNIKLYNSDGVMTGTLVYNRQSVVHIPSDSISCADQNATNNTSLLPSPTISDHNLSQLCCTNSPQQIVDSENPLPHLTKTSSKLESIPPQEAHISETSSRLESIPSHLALTKTNSKPERILSLQTQVKETSSKQSIPPLETQVYSNPIPTPSVAQDYNTDTCELTVHIPDLESETLAITCPSSRALTSTIARGIAHIIGHNEDIYTFDDITHQLKTSIKLKTQRGLLQKRYEELLAMLTSKVLQEKALLSERAKHIEMKAFKLDKVLPTMEGNEEYKHIQLKLKFAKRLLHKLNIKL